MNNYLIFGAFDGHAVPLGSMQRNRNDTEQCDGDASFLSANACHWESSLSNENDQHLNAYGNSTRFF